MRALPLVLLVAACASDTDPLACPEAPGGDAGELTAMAAQRCNVPGSMGSQNWYRLVAQLPGSDDIVQLELWPNRGTFAGQAIGPGTYEITGDDLDFATCGICLRAMADKGGALQREMFAIGGTVTIEDVSAVADAPFSATIENAAFAEVDGDKVPVDGGCTMDVARVRTSGTLVIMGGAGGGGGGAGGSGNMGCPTTVGD